MAEMCACMYVCCVIVHLPSFGCETSCQILNYLEVQECIGVHVIQGQEVYLVIYMYITLATCELPNAVPICYDFHTLRPGDVLVHYTVQYILYSISHTDTLHISHSQILLKLVITTLVYVTSRL
jgi:hypothetical protein